MDSLRPISNEIKRRGVMFDRNKLESLQARVGDIVVLYNTRNIPFDMQPPEMVYAFSEYGSGTSQR